MQYTQVALHGNPKAGARTPACFNLSTINMSDVLHAVQT
jgi:hypothetical protein